MNYLLGVDIGTSGTKTVLFDETGKAISSKTKEYSMYQPKNGWAEQDPDDWWNACVETIHAVLENSGISPADVAGVGLSGQMHGLVMLDQNGAVLRRSIIWCDGRTGDQCREINERVGADRLIEITANPALAGFTASKILWVRENEPDTFRLCKYILLPKDFVRYKLTGLLGMEVSDASGMNLMDLPRRKWSGEVLERLEIDAGLLPDLHESCEVAGGVSEDAAGPTGLLAGTPVVFGGGDNACAAVGTGVVEQGKAFTTIGTSGVIYAHADQLAIDPKGRVHTFCSAVPGKWTVMGCTLAAGLSLKWMRDNFFLSEMKTASGMGVDPYHLMDQQAARVPIGANRLLFLPYLMGERSPLLDPNARGVFFGLSAIHTKYDMLRAVMEGVVYSLKNCMDILQGMGAVSSEMLACGGGGSSPLWRQMLADVYGCPVKTVVSKEGPALGAAILAGVGAGVFESVEQGCRALIQTNPEQRPDPDQSAQYEPYYRLYSRLYADLKEPFQLLSTL